MAEFIIGRVSSKYRVLLKISLLFKFFDLIFTYNKTLSFSKLSYWFSSHNFLLRFSKSILSSIFLKISFQAFDHPSSLIVPLSKCSKIFEYLARLYSLIYGIEFLFG